MHVVRTEEALRAALAEWRANRRSIGFVPTMGALHAGHMSLVERARAENDVLTASIFVNPLQFGEREDLSRYPRTEAADLASLEEAGADVVLVGSTEDMYPAEFATRVEISRVTSGGEGAERPGHFPGVTTVVAKLFGMFTPTRAYFGWKDMQQCCVIRRMVRDLSYPLEVVPCEIVRESDGLACSSRNRYLSSADRAKAPALYRALRAARELWRGGESRGDALCALVRARLADDFRLDYVELRDEEDYRELTDPITGGRIVAAARLGGTRLLDNLELAR